MLLIFKKYLIINRKTFKAGFLPNNKKVHKLNIQAQQTKITLSAKSFVYRCLLAALVSCIKRELFLHMDRNSKNKVVPFEFFELVNKPVVWVNDFSFSLNIFKSLIIAPRESLH